MNDEPRPNSPEDVGYTTPEQPSVAPAELSDMQRRVLGRVQASRYTGHDCASLFAVQDLRRMGLITGTTKLMITHAGVQALAHARRKKP